MAEEAVVVASSRTGLAKSFRGSFNMTRPDDLAAHCIKDVVGKVPNLDPADVEDVILGCANPEGKQGNNVARIAAVLGGLPVSVAGTTVNRFCSSGLQSVAMAAHEIINEGATASIGGGVESITMLSGGGDPNPKAMEMKPGLYMVMGDTAEVVAKRYGISREAQDEFSAISQERTAAAQERGFFAEEIANMEVTMGLFNKETKQMDGEQTVVVDKDECNRPGTTAEALGGLKPYFDPDSGKGTVTAGNASQLSDGASATLLMNRNKAEELGVKPKVAFRGFAIAGCEPDEMGIGPVYAIPKLLKRHGLTVNDINLWELNEAFAVQVLYCQDKMGIDIDKLNINGGSISIGHPFGMTGSRMVGTLANQMVENQAQFGVVTMCIGGGQGAAGLFELI
jgi:acetyl-CoA acetyltransferase family protein